MSVQYSPRIITDGLILCLDAGSSESYSGAGTVWNDLCYNYNFNLVNTPTFETHRGAKCFNFSGADDYATRAGTIFHDIGNKCTLTLVMASVNNTNFGSCSRLFSVNDGSSNNVDFSEYFTLASCDQTKFGLWYQNNPGGLYSTTLLKTVNDEYRMITYKWTASSTASIFINNLQEASANTTSAFNFLNVQRMTVGMNSALNIENSTIRVAYILMYNKELTSTEIQQNYNAIKGRFGL